MRNQWVLEFLQSTDDTLEGSSDVCEVGNTTTDDENLSLGIGGTTSYKINYKVRQTPCSCIKNFQNALIVFAYS